jgi:hypothetical protein
MSSAAHPHSPVRKQNLRDGRRATVIAVACVATLAALLVALVLALPGDDAAPSGSDGASAAQQPPIPQAGSPYATPGTRYDGGPDEGTRGAVEQPPIPQAGSPYATPASGPHDGTDQ